MKYYSKRLRFISVLRALNFNLLFKYIIKEGKYYV